MIHTAIIQFKNKNTPKIIHRWACWVKRSRHVHMLVSRCVQVLAKNLILDDLAVISPLWPSSHVQVLYWLLCYLLCRTRRTSIFDFMYLCMLNLARWPQAFLSFFSHFCLIVWVLSFFLIESNFNLVDLEVVSWIYRMQCALNFSGQNVYVTLFKESWFDYTEATKTAW